MTTESDYQKSAEVARDEINAVSPTFCRAKWKQVTIHLHNGTTHSCHHPTQHKVPLDELLANPSALHNTSIKNRARMDLLNGVQTKECNYCWNIENANPSAFSDRHYKSGEDWAKVGEPISLDNPQLFGNPSYVEVSFSHVCNFKCSYCSPIVSSSWVEDIKQHGPIQISDHALNDLDWLKKQGSMPIPEREDNPYVEAFWKWWPDLYPSLKVFRITGGEPLLSKHTWKVLDYIDKHPRPDLQLAINTNLGVPFKFIERFVQYTNRMIAENKIGGIDIYTSVDTWGPQAAYIRDGMNWDEFYHNFNYVLDNVTWVKERAKMIIMCTFNLLSIPNFRPLLEFVLDWRKNYNNVGIWKSLWIDISYLRYPTWQTAQLATPDLLKTLDSHLDFMKDHFRQPDEIWGFQDVEVEKLERLITWAKLGLDEKSRTKELKNFYMFFKEYDRRRGLDFTATFPTIVDLWNEAKQIVEEK